MLHVNTVYGINPVGVAIEGTPSRDPGVRVTGIADAAAREVRVRVQSTLGRFGVMGGADVHVRWGDAHTGDRFAAQPWPDAALDLPIALEAARAMGAIEYDGRRMHPYGELGLNGQLRPIRGACCRADHRQIWIPHDNAAEVSAFPRTGAKVVAFRSFGEVLRYLTDGAAGEVVAPKPLDLLNRPQPFDYPRLAEHKPFAALLEIARSSTPRALLVGAPGTGRTVLSRNLARALGPMTEAEMLETTRIRSVAGLVDVPTTSRPFRAPHHTVSVTGLCGGGARPRPGEASLAHCGVLMLDEATEFSRNALASLAVLLARGETTLGSFPACPSAIVATAHPCPCGYLGSANRQCRCSDEAMQRHAARLAWLEETLKLRRLDVGDALSASMLQAMA